MAEIGGGRNRCGAGAVWCSVNTTFRFATALSGRRASSAESPPSNQQRGSQSQQQVDDSSPWRHPKGESCPRQQRSQGHQKSHHECTSPVLVDRAQLSSYFTSEWAAVGSHVIEPTGPMKGGLH